MSPYLETAILAARDAGEYIRQAAADIGLLHIEQKSLHDYVSEVDRTAESKIAKVLGQRFPDHSMVGEEFGLRGANSAAYQWVIDPLDGTTNFLRSIPHYAVSIALLHKGQIVTAIVYDPAKDDMFTAEQGKGAFLNGHAISINNLSNIKGALLSTGIPFSGKNLDQISSFTHTMEGLLAEQTSGIRRLGAAALDLAYTACGRYDGFWEANLNIWDIAAGVLLVTEAGGVVTDLQGGQSQIISGNILAANSNVHADMLAITSKYYTS